MNIGEEQETVRQVPDDVPEAPESPAEPLPGREQEPDAVPNMTPEKEPVPAGVGGGAS